MKVIDAVKETADFFRQVDRDNFPLYMENLKRLYKKTGMKDIICEVMQKMYDIALRDSRKRKDFIYSNSRRLYDNFIKEFKHNYTITNTFKTLPLDDDGKYDADLKQFCRSAYNILELYGPKKIVDFLKTEQ